MIYFLGSGFECLYGFSVCAWDDSSKMTHEVVIPAKELITKIISKYLRSFFIGINPFNSTGQNFNFFEGINL